MKLRVALAAIALATVYAFVISQGARPASAQPACVGLGGLPDRRCTPGQALPDVTAQQVCVPGYASRVRAVSAATRARVLAEYGVTEAQAGGGRYEVDHLISLELGGSNSAANLFPQPADRPGSPGYQTKDRLENALHAAVCSGRMSLSEAQLLISTDWIAAQRRVLRLPATGSP